MRIHTTAFTSLVARFAIKAVPYSTSWLVSPRRAFTATWKTMLKYVSCYNIEIYAGHSLPNKKQLWYRKKITVCLLTHAYLASHMTK